MKKRRLLAWLMTLAMMIGLMPATVLAEESTATLTPDPVTVTRDGDTLATLSKTAVDNGDGTYDITLSVTASETIESQPVKIVLVLDSSGSMAWCTSDEELHEHTEGRCYKLNCDRWHWHGDSCYVWTCTKEEHTHEGGGTECQIVEGGADSRMEIVKAKAIDMLSDIADIGGNVKIAVVDFDSSASTECDLTPVTAANIAEDGPIVEAINGMEAEGGTRPHAGLVQANNILNAGDPYAKKVVILLADGDADTGYADDAISQADSMKDDDIEIFTIGFKTDADMLEEIATDANHYATADSDTDLEAIFDKIVKGLAAMILDPMGGFVDLKGGENGIEVTLGGDTYSEGLQVTEEEQIEWNKQGGLTKNQTVTLKYTVVLDEDEFLDEDAGTHEVPLNGAAKLNYSYENEGGQAYFPVPTATVGIGQLVEKYYVDGELVETVKADKVIIRGEKEFTWAADASVLDEEVKYVESKHGEDVVEATGAVEATAGEYVVKHYYTTDLEATLYVNAQDQNGKAIEIAGLTDTVHKVVNSYDISADYPGTITVGEDKYIFDGVIEGKLSDTVTKDGQVFLVILQYSKVDIDIEKTVDGDKSIKRGQWVRYEITVKNTGDADLTNVVVTETPDEDQFAEGEFVDVPKGVTVDGDKATIAKLAVGETVTLIYKAKVDSDAARGKELINKVEVTSNEGAKDSDENDDAYVPKKSGGGSSSKKDKEIVAGDVEEILNTEDHFQYVQGYPDGTVGPERNITRAEATVIFFRLLQDHVREELLTAENNFPDVDLDDWFNLGVSTMEYGGFVTGYEDGTFRPNGKITRAELATIISNFDELEPATENRFPDVEGHWAEAYINSAAEKGWLSGYEDGLYRPNQYITRAETMSMINRVLNRRVDADGLHTDAKQWVDNPESKWYYYAVLEATNHHDYQRADVSDYENWTAINPEKIWEN